MPKERFGLILDYIHIEVGISFQNCEFEMHWLNSLTVHVSTLKYSIIIIMVSLTCNPGSVILSESVCNIEKLRVALV